jgi:hypothetical protein
MTSTSGDGPAAGWYPDPEHPDRQRYWDGVGWTEHRHPSTSASASPPTLDETAVLPVAPRPGPDDRPVQPAAAPREAGSDRSGVQGWVAALAGLIAGLVIGGTAAAVIVGNSGSDSSAPRGGGASAATAASTVTATSTATESVTATATATATATETVTATVTATASP